MISFRIEGVPIAQPRQRHRVIPGPEGTTRVGNYTPKRHPVTDWKAFIRAAAQISMEGRQTLEGPLGLRICFVMPRPKAKHWKRIPMPRYPHAIKPDVDNLIKAVCDARAGVVWIDDRQVASVAAEKWVAAGGEGSHATVSVWEIDGREAADIASEFLMGRDET